MNMGLQVGVAPLVLVEPSSTHHPLLLCTLDTLGLLQQHRQMEWAEVYTFLRASVVFHLPVKSYSRIKMLSTCLLPEPKWCNHDTSAKKNFLQVIQHHTHPVRQTLCYLERSLTLLWKLVARAPSSIEIVSMTSLRKSHNSAYQFPSKADIMCLLDWGS